MIGIKEHPAGAEEHLSGGRILGVVKCSCIIHRGVDYVYDYIRNYGVLTEFIPNAEDCKLVDENKTESGAMQKYRWLGGGRIMGVSQKINWLEEDRWDDRSKSLTFRQLEGDYKKYSGKWQFTGDGGRTTMQVLIDFKLDHPLMTFAVEVLLDRMMRKNCEAMLDNLKRKIEKS